jgi:hypothetical protein
MDFWKVMAAIAVFVAVTPVLATLWVVSFNTFFLLFTVAVMRVVGL